MSRGVLLLLLLLLDELGSLVTVVSVTSKRAFFLSLYVASITFAWSITALL